MSQTKAQLIDPVDLSIVTADLADDAVTAAKLASNAVVNASVDASAAIAGTKISPDFGSQNIVTTGGLTVDTTTFHVDSSNNKVGIGTVSPTGKLDVRGQANVGFQALRLVNTQHDTNAQGASQLKFGITNSLGERNVRIEGKEVANNSNDLALDFYTNLASSTDGEVHRMRLDQTGMLIVMGNTTTVNTTPSKNGLVSYYETDQGNAHFGTYSSGGSTNLNFVTNNGGGAFTTRMSLTHDGKVLIGTTTKNSNDKFQVHDAGDVFMSIRSDAAADNTRQFLDFGTGTGDRSSTNLTGVIKASIHSQSGGTLKSDLIFSTNTGNSIDEKLIIKDTGNVGIGTTSPNADVDIATSVEDSTGTLAKHGVRLFHVGATDEEVIPITGGFVTQVDRARAGIGFISKQASSTDGYAGAIGFYTRSAADGTGLLRTDERMRIDSSGKVGIGNNSPSFTLDTRAGREDALRLGNTLETGHGTHNVKIAAGNTYYQDLKFNTSDVKFETYNGSSLGERFRVRNNGGVTFNGDTADANALDDYEEGTFTPSITYETSDDGNKVYTTQSASYTKIGRVVHCNITIILSNRGTGSGRLVINNLPFSVGDYCSGTILEASGTVGFFSGLISSVSDIKPVAIQGTSTAVLYGVLGTHAASTGDFTYNYIGNAFSFRASITFFRD